MDTVIVILATICICGALAFFLLLTWALCVMASRNEYISEKDWEEYCRRGDDDGESM